MKSYTDYLHQEVGSLPSCCETVNPNSDSATGWQPRTYTKPEDKFTYVLVAGDHIKIGVAVDIPSRLKGMQTGNPYPLRVLDCGRGNVERFLLSKCRRFHVGGEWFTMGALKILEAFYTTSEQCLSCRCRAEMAREAVDMTSRAYMSTITGQTYPTPTARAVAEALHKGEQFIVTDEFDEPSEE